MSALNQLTIVDIRDKLPRSKLFAIGTRDATTSATWHWNGPATRPSAQFGDGLIAQLIADTNYQMQPGWGGSVSGADGLMYHVVIDALGTIYQTRSWLDMLWHCAQQDGNAHGLSIHFPVGTYPDGTEQPLTYKQLQKGIALTNALCSDFHIPANRVFGHQEWKHATSCPGTLIMSKLHIYRDGVQPQPTPTVVPAGIQQFLVDPTMKDVANVRQGPGRSFPVAGRYKPGTLIYVDVVKDDGEPVAPDNDRRWVHLAKIPNEQADLGFLSMTVLVPAPGASA